jgi:hypothetical protein
MKEKSGGKGKVFASNFLYSGEIFPPRIPLTFTVELKPLLVKVLLLRISMNDTNGRRFCTDHKRIQTDCFQADVTKFTVFFLIVVLPCMLTITQLLLQQNAHFYY